MGTALKEGLPLKLVKKQGDAVSAAVGCGHKSGGYSLNQLELCGQFFVWGSQTVDAYFKMGRTQVLSACSLTGRRKLARCLC